MRQQEAQEEKKWKAVPYSYQIADTGDYDGHWEITNGDITLYTKEDTDDDFKPLIDALNEYGDGLYMDDSAYWEAESYKQRIIALESELAVLRKMGPKKICYCGSLHKAMDAFKKAEYESVLRGEIALLPCCMFVDIEREYGAESDYKAKADDLHKRKIDICDEVFVLNVGGYIGSSTRSEIDYALSIGKPVKYLEPLPTSPETNQSE